MGLRNATCMCSLHIYIYIYIYILNVIYEHEYG